MRKEGGREGEIDDFSLFPVADSNLFLKLLLKPNDDPAELFLDDVNGAINYLKLLHTGGDQTAT